MYIRVCVYTYTHIHMACRFTSVHSVFIHSRGKWTSVLSTWTTVLSPWMDENWMHTKKGKSGIKIRRLGNCTREIYKQKRRWSNRLGPVVPEQPALFIPLLPHLLILNYWDVGLSYTAALVGRKRISSLGYQRWAHQKSPISQGRKPTLWEAVVDVWFY